MDTFLIFGGFGLLLSSLVVMFIAVFAMMRVINLDPGPKGRIRPYTLLNGLYRSEVITRYRAKPGKNSLFMLLQLGWVLFGVGLFAVWGDKIVERVLHR